MTAFAAGCGDDDEAGEAKRETTAAPTTFVVEATAEGRRKLLDFPASVKAGLVAVTLKNSDSRPRSLQILRVEGDHTIDDVLKIVESEEPAKIPSWMQDGGGMGRVAPGETATATQVLAPGTWVLWDDEGAEEGPSNSELGAKGSFAVTGPAVDAELPAQPAAVTASDDGEDEYGFDFKGLKAGTNRVRFENTGEELHHALFFPMRRGATIEDVLEAFQAEGEPEGPPPVDFAKGVGTAVIDGGTAQNISLDLPAGRYAVVCFISDRDGGEPHAAKGMLEELTIE
ncbi:MAG TPA: hypothetical protein VG474_04610 [Solirubrobacteraceae bacterium]|nr:hypothetical protein [Solirubrobacteraceae bacterium]